MMIAALALNAALVLPWGIWTAVGTVNWVLLDESAILSPPVGAGAVNMSVQAVCPEPVSVCGPHETVAAEFCAARRVTDCETLPAAETEAVVLDATDAALMVKVALLIPVPIVTTVGVVRLTEEETREIEVLACAGLFNVSVQVPVPGVWMDVGVHTRVAFKG